VKRSKAETAETRRRIIETAAREFRHNGIHATGLADVMAAAGLTHGGFYRHFQSKDQLVAEACAAGMDSIVARAEAAACQSGSNGGLNEIVESYLSVNHRDDRAGGCPLAGLGSELARADNETRETVSEGILRFFEVLAKRAGRRKPELAKSDALFVLSALVGAVTLSRMTTNTDLSNAILSETKRHLARP
jgi:TetR/AcrR family transcriptional repressor of nem operon